MLAAEIDGQLDVVAERARGRADALVALPRMAWAVSTDVATVRDMTADELALAPRTGETIEIAQWNIATSQSTRLLRVPPDGVGPIIPIEQAGEHFLASPQGIFFAVVRMIDARQRAEEVKGLIGVAEKWDPAAVEKRLVSMRAKLRIETANGATVWGPPAAAVGQDDHVVIIPLRATAAAGSRLVFTAAPPRASRRGILVPVGGALIVAAALAFWRDRRGRSSREVAPSSSRAKLKTNVDAKVESKAHVARAASEATAPGGPTPTAAANRRAMTASTASSPAATAGSAAGRGVAAAAASRLPDRDAPESDTNPEIPIPAIPPALVTTARFDASVVVRETPAAMAAEKAGAAKPIRGPGVEAPAPLVTPPFKPYLPRASSPVLRSSSQVVPLPEPASADVPMDYHGTERIGVATSSDGELQGQPAVIGDDWGAANPQVVRTLRRLYNEFLALRRTCGERTDNIDYDKFVVTLRRRREELIARHLFKEVTFRIAFNDGKAIVRSTGIR